MEALQPIPSLTAYRDQIAGVLNATAIDIGTILIEAKHRHPREFMQWVAAELPFSYEKAQRLMAISRAFRSLPEEQRQHLPAPWTTLFTLSALGTQGAAEAIEAGAISPTMTNQAALGLIGRDAAPAPKPKRGDPPGPPPGQVGGSGARPGLGLLLREVLRYDPSDLAPYQRQALDEWLRGEEDGARSLVDREGQLSRV